MKKISKQILKKILTPEQYNTLREIYFYQIKTRIYSNNLKELAIIYGSDKWNPHWYTPHYQRRFQSLRKKRLNILEIGVGEYGKPNKGGASLRMWKRYFPYSRIYSIDIYDKSALQEDRIAIFRGNQADEKFLKDIYQQIGSLDIVIDDGSHVNSHVITSFKALFPLLNDNGIYVVEDTQTSYWPKYGKEQYGGDSDNLNNPTTIMGFFKSLSDGLNHAEFIRPGYSPNYFDKHIVSMHFYHNLIFIYKGHNDEGSNIVRNNMF